MEDFCVILAHHALIGEIARAKQLLQSSAANMLQVEARKILECCFGLALGNIQDSLSKLHEITAHNYQ